jgi:hypothetical protein
MTISHHDPTEFMGGVDWSIDGALFDATGAPLDLSNATLTWTLIGPDGLPLLTEADVNIQVTPPATSGLIVINVGNDKTAQLECGQLGICGGKAR